MFETEANKSQDWLVFWKGADGREHETFKFGKLFEIVEEAPGIIGKDDIAQGLELSMLPALGRRRNPFKFRYVGNKFEFWSDSDDEGTLDNSIRIRWNRYDERDLFNDRVCATSRVRKLFSGYVQKITEGDKKDFDAFLYGYKGHPILVLCIGTARSELDLRRARDSAGARRMVNAALVKLFYSARHKG